MLIMVSSSPINTSNFRPGLCWIKMILIHTTAICAFRIRIAKDANNRFFKSILENIICTPADNHTRAFTSQFTDHPTLCHKKLIR